MSALRNFDTDLDRQRTSRIIRTTQEVEVTETVSAKPSPRNESREDLLQGEWGWRELRDYVVTQIEEIHGTFPRQEAKEYGVFSRFINQYGPDAEAIARFAFEIEGGFWKGAPISINRFCKNSDPYFAEPILERLRDALGTLRDASQ